MRDREYIMITDKGNAMLVSKDPDGRMWVSDMGYHSNDSLREFAAMRGIRLVGHVERLEGPVIRRHVSACPA